MIAIPVSELRDSLHDELASQVDWQDRLDDFGAPRWKLEQVRDAIDELSQACDLADLEEELAELSLDEVAAIRAADRLGIWDV